MSNAPTWKIAAEPVAAEAAALEHEDKLLTELANAHFDRAAPSVDASVVAAPHVVPQPVAPLPVHAVDPDYQAVHAALQAGTIPTFADEAGAAPSPSQPLDAAAEREAYAAFVQFIQQGHTFLYFSFFKRDVIQIVNGSFKIICILTATHGKDAVHWRNIP